MKTSTLLSVLFSVPAVIYASACAQEVKTDIREYLPCDGSFKQGAVVQIARDASFIELHKAAVERFTKLPKEKQTELNKDSNPNKLLAWNADIWPDKAEYERYKEAWKKSRIVPRADVALGLRDNGNNQFSVLSATRMPDGSTMPLTIGSLRYDGNRNVWKSNNGELKPKAFSAGEDFDFGAQTGTEWSMEKEDSLSKLRETLLITKTTDGKAVYLAYSMNEISAISGTVIANHGYILLFPIQTERANATKPGRR
ncbi:MAG: hypothetical protein IJB00_07405 [Akkermansia sp.]|nr:hypothetical protein [Akkermansia sp.]